MSIEIKKKSLQAMLIVLVVCSISQLIVAQDGELEPADDSIGVSKETKNTKVLSSASLKDLDNDHVRLESIVEPIINYHYASNKRGDPFIPPQLFKVTQKQKISALEIPITSSLQHFKLTNLKLTGIWSNNSGDYKVMIKTPKNDGVIVKKGDLIGSMGGEIVNVSKNSITVREYYQTVEGIKEFDDKQLFLGEAKESLGKIKFIPGKKTSQVINGNQDLESSENEE